MECVYKKTGILFKLLPCLLILMIAFMTLYGSYVYATNDYSIDDLKTDTFYSITSEYNNFAFHRLSSSYFIYELFLTNNDFAVGATANNGLHLSLSTNGSVTRYRFDGRQNDADWIFVDTFNCFSRDKLFNLSSELCDEPVYSNAPIENVSNLQVFQAPPQQVEGAQGIVATQIQPVEMNKTQQEIIAMLPIVLVVIVGLIALRKAIQFLMRIMRKA